ncbi:MAG TPA: molybdenum cofactor biosynthesis protein MoaE [Thermoanaerobaculia bacterium]|nr:molybdenum cofactor biosynthesis protein MoaE [Thermoanaerobaculia bacterium]
MRVRVVAFATAAEALGSGERDVELPEGGSLADLRELLERDHPALIALWPRLALAVDGRLAAGDVPLAAGAEVALLPPVSGGSPGGEGQDDRRVRLVDGPLDAGGLTAAVADPSRGAVVVFSGTVRDHHQGRPVARLDYTAYRPMAEAALGRILGEIESANRDLRAAVSHRLGEVAVGEPSVVIAVASPHRAAAFEAAREVLERLKREVPIWKREHYADGGAAWREEEALTASAPAVAAPSR